MNTIETLKKRGLIETVSGGEGELDLWLNAAPRTIYFGFDPTAYSLHVGHTVPLLIARTLKKAGHRIIILAGGATGMIGDPSERTEERNLMDFETLKENAVLVTKQVQGILNDDSILYVNNYDWFSKINSLDYLRDIGKHISVHQLLKRESVQKRLNNESFFSYTEFSYSLIQGYDFAHLSQSHDCSVQIGGGDQWGNILMGIELSKKIHNADVFGIACPLILDSKTGKKIGKSEGNAIWLDPRKLSPYSMYQYFLQTDDADIAKRLLIFTELSDNEIKTIMNEHTLTPENRIAQKALAYGAVSVFHKTVEADKAKLATEILFNEYTGELDSEKLGILSSIIPSITLYEERSLINIMAESGIVSSKREARQLIADKGLSVNGIVIDDENHSLIVPCILRKGKKDYYLLTE